MITAQLSSPSEAFSRPVVSKGIAMCNALLGTYGPIHQSPEFFYYLHAQETLDPTLQINLERWREAVNTQRHRRLIV